MSTQIKRSVGRPKKITPFDDIITIKWLFKNPEWDKDQEHKKRLLRTKNWKEQHHDDILDYHKTYNETHNVKEKMAGFCDVCQKHFASIHQHKRTKKHIIKTNAPN